MAKEPACRKWQITINNPMKHGLPHEQIKDNLSTLKSIEYWCMCDEIGEGGLKLGGVAAVVLDGVCVSHDLRLLKAGQTA